MSQIEITNQTFNNPKKTIKFKGSLRRPKENSIYLKQGEPVRIYLNDKDCGQVTYIKEVVWEYNDRRTYEIELRLIGGL